jgi:glycosyltransferase involved in cell wall biosynthesis
MTSETAERVRINPPYAAARPVLSVLIPYYRDDPCDLVRALDREAPRLHGAVEIVLLDDGTNIPAHASRVEQQVAALRLPVRFVQLAQNEGRAKARNRLAAHARGSAYLFLDADMRPDDDRFLASWADLVAREDPAVAFGGVSLKQASRERKYQVARRMAQRAECTPYYERALRPEKYVYTSNLLIRRDAFEAEAFDAGFDGWGWEDVEWGMRIARRFTVVHVDIPASHLGLDTARGLAAKYEQSVENFARVVGRHPDIVSLYPSYRVARALKKTPGLNAWRPWLKSFALAPVLPASARALSLRLYRAALYAEAV